MKSLYLIRCDIFPFYLILLCLNTIKLYNNFYQNSKYIINNFRHGFTLIEMAIVLFIQNKKACRSYPHTF
ncbi:prepilin-type N-terminal cleavage/methylation domain-containing protein [Ligilactobacillus salivarius]|uniref:prepilin-type N-terminal cleavage/methylation domain-containing protein n=1 Tax=Ligilactobacillus salivarius TaxID=1624 RepID=UPI003437459B